MDIFSYSVANSRYCAALTNSVGDLLVPVQTNIAVWDWETGSRKKIIQSNSNLIKCLIENEKFVVSIANNGETVFLDKLTLEPIKTFSLQIERTTHASINKDYLALISAPDPLKGKLVVYQIKTSDDVASELRLEKIMELDGPYRHCHLTPSKTLFTALEHLPIGIKQEELKIETESQEIASQKQVIELEVPSIQKNKSKEPVSEAPKAAKWYSYHSFCLESGKEDKEPITEELISDIMNSSSNGKDRVAVLYYSRRVLIFNSEKLFKLASFNIEDNGPILTSIFYNTYSLYLTPKSNWMLIVDCKENLETLNEKTILLKDAEEKKHSSLTAIPFKSIGVGPRNSSFVWRKVNEQSYSCNEDGIYLIDFKTGVQRNVSLFSITCCGLALSQDGKLVACGDFGGNVMVFTTDKCLDYHPRFQTTLFDNSRSLVWSPDDERIYIGGLEGSLYRWNYKKEGESPELLQNLDAGIMCMRSRKHEASNIYIMGTGGGYAYVFQEDSQLELKLTHKFLAHAPQPDNTHPRFPSINMYAEVWSLTFAPSGVDHIATVSEDQTCSVWKLDFSEEVDEKKRQKGVEILKGHTWAVTSVDWKVMNEDLGEILVTCSDERTFRVYDVKNGFKFLYDDTTKNLDPDFHTLTYLALESGGSRVAIVSTNGFLFIYDLKKKVFTYAEEIHTGSIEGLEWKNGMLVTCSSDNSINVIKIK